MLIFKIISLFFVFVLSILQFRQETAFIKWASILLCASILLIGIVDLIKTHKEQEYLNSQVLKDASRISWEHASAQILLMNDVADIEKGAQQVIFKVIPSNFSFGDINGEEILKNIESSAYGYDYIPENMAGKLWHAMAEKDGSIAVKKEKAKGIESIYFNESMINKDPFQGTDVELKIEYIPTAMSKYTSLHDLKGNMIVARIVTKTKVNPYIGWVKLNLRSNAGSLILHFHPKRISLSSPVRYVGVFLNGEKFGI